MGCSCGSTEDGQVSGCKNNGACNTGGCNKMNVFDWLSNMDTPMQDKFDVVEVRFKNGRKEAFKQSEQVVEFLTKKGFPPLKVVREFVVHDTHITLDQEWH